MSLHITPTLALNKLFILPGGYRCSHHVSTEPFGSDFNVCNKHMDTLAGSYSIIQTSDEATMTYHYQNINSKEKKGRERFQVVH